MIPILEKLVASDPAVQIVIVLAIAGYFVARMFKSSKVAKLEAELTSASTTLKFSSDQIDWSKGRETRLSDENAKLRKNLLDAEYVVASLKSQLAASHKPVEGNDAT